MIILIADDEAGVRNSLKLLLQDKHECLLCEDGASALKQIEKVAVDIVITDHQMPGMTGLELIRKGKATSPSTAFLLMTAYGSFDQAVEAIRLGADDYFTKPFDLDEVEHRVHRIEDLRSWKSEQELKDGEPTGVQRLIGSSASIRAAREFVTKVAEVASPVLLLGPSGSGKEVMARALHESGPRAMRPFIAINCASLSEQLMESELFGHEKGAFTGATAAKPGKFELAKGGTLFLDEVGELSPGLQAKLLRVLQEKEFYRVGGLRQLKSDARVIAATHQPLKEMVKAGTFREDLFFRLNVLTFELMPLHQRREDIPLLIDFLWLKLSKEMGRRLVIPAEVKLRLAAYPFPGNVRELQNVLERLMVLSGKDRVEETALPAEFFPAQPAGAGEGPVGKTGEDLPPLGPDRGLTEVIETLEARLVFRAMKEAGDNQGKAAELLRITRGALQYKLKKYGYGTDGTEGAAAA